MYELKLNIYPRSRVLTGGLWNHIISKLQKRQQTVFFLVHSTGKWRELSIIHLIAHFTSITILPTGFPSNVMSKKTRGFTILKLYKRRYNVLQTTYREFSQPKFYKDCCTCDAMAESQSLRRLLLLANRNVTGAGLHEMSAWRKNEQLRLMIAVNLK